MSEAEQPVPSVMQPGAPLTTTATGTNSTPAQAPSTPFNPENQMAVSVANMEELRKKAREVYDAMMEGVARRIIADMRRHQQRFKEIQRRGRQR